MTAFYLITGFLGAGKTTFLKNFIRLFPGKRVHLIINEFGRTGIDGILLREMDATLSEINGGSVFCACRLDRFEAVLAESLTRAPDVILCEASGLSDPTKVRRVLSNFPAAHYRGSICLADALRLEKVFSTAQMCPRQIAVSGLVLLNKTDLATPEQCLKAEALIATANPAAIIRRTSWGQMDLRWLALLAPDSGSGAPSDQPDLTLQSAALEVSETMPVAALEMCLATLAEETYRIKGFLRLAEGAFHVDCTGPTVALTLWTGETENTLVLLAGRGMAMRKAVKTAIQWYGEFLSLK